MSIFQIETTFEVSDRQARRWLKAYWEQEAARDGVDRYTTKRHPEYQDYLRQQEEREEQQLSKIRRLQKAGRMKKNVTLSLSQEANAMLGEMYTKLIKSSGWGSRSAIVERLIREAYKETNGNDKE